MIMNEIIETFRSENPRFKTKQSLPEATIMKWCKLGDKDVCARTRCLPGDFNFECSVDVSKYDLTRYESKFFDIDEYPGGGISYNDKRIYIKTIAELDFKSRSWRTANSGTPTKYYRRGKYIHLVPTPSKAETIEIYCILISDDFDSGEKTPYNGLTYLEPYHYAIVKFIKWKSEQKSGGTRADALIAKAEYEDYVAYVKKMLGGTKYGPIKFIRGN